MEMAEDGAHIHPYVLGRYRGKDDDGIARHSGQPELVDRQYVEHCASHPSDGKSDKFDERNNAKCSAETPSIPAHPTLAPASNVVVLVKNSEAAVEEKRDAAVLPLQIAQLQETHEVTQTGVEDQGIGVGEVEVGDLMAESAPARSDKASLNASQPVISKA